MADADEAEAVWVESEVAPDGTYVVGFHHGPDRAWVLSRDEAIRHAVAVTTQAERAEYDAAVLTLLHEELKMPLQEAVNFLQQDIRPDRPPVDEPSPLTVEPGVSQRGGLHGFLTLHLDGAQVGQWGLGDARSHAVNVLQAVAAVDNDAALHRLLHGVIGLDGQKARSVVAGIGEHRRKT